MKKYYFKWLDSTQSEGGWVDLEELRAEPYYDKALELESVGFLVKQTDADDVYSVSIFANSYDPTNNTVEGVYSIPTCAITEMVEWK